MRFDRRTSVFQTYINNRVALLLVIPAGMESSSRKLQEEQKKQDEIRKQIALLQSQLVDLADEEPRSPARTGSKRTQDSEGNSNHRDTILAPPTPSPKSEFS